MDFGIRRLAAKTIVAAVAAAAAGSLVGGPAAAETAAASPLLYDYNFAGTTGTVKNSAPNGPHVSLKLFGTWSAVMGGVHFSGNASGHESVAYGKPASGYTLDEPSSAAVGLGAVVRYNRPAGGKCFSDTPNLTQMGRYGPRSVQAKIQFTNCATSTTQVMMECRFAGGKAAPASDEVVSTLPLVNAAKYRVSCVKSPDTNGKTTVTLKVTRISTGQTVTTTATEPAMGAMKTKEYISAGNKYPLPVPAANTSQFNGDMFRTVYCAGTTAQVNGCLAAYLPSS
jgi:hypothetical protein